MYAEVVRVLVEAGADVNKGLTIRADTLAAHRGNVKAVRALLLGAGVDMNQQGDTSTRPSTPLGEAAATGDVEVVDALIQPGVDVNRKASITSYDDVMDDDGTRHPEPMTPLDIARLKMKRTEDRW